MSDIKLKPCPHCGREDCCASAVDHGNTKQERWWGNIFCRGCNMNGPDIGPEDTYEAWFEKAVEVWNALPRHLQWTTKTPTKPGWYWCRSNVQPKDAAIVFVKDGAFELDEELIEAASLRFQWAGPIDAPKEKK